MTIPSKKSFRRGLSYAIPLSVKDHLGRPAGADKPNHASITADFGTSNKNYKIQLDKYREGSLKLDVPSNAEALRITVSDQLFLSLTKFLYASALLTIFN